MSQQTTDANEEGYAPEARVLAVGDIHGCLTAFETLLHAVELQPSDRLIVLGDVIDRGLASRGVVEQLLALREQCQLVCLLGNHEQMLLDVVDGRMPLQQWLRYGGSETLDSYRLEGGIDAVDPGHLKYMREWGDYYETATHFFAHGNYAAQVSLGQQQWDVQRWVSLHQNVPTEHTSGKTAVLGHTANKQGQVVNLGHLVCIDTYCHGDGWLTALEPASGKTWQANEQGESQVGLLAR